MAPQLASVVHMDYEPVNTPIKLKTPPPPKLDYLEGIRGWAALCVVFVHYANSLKPVSFFPDTDYVRDHAAADPSDPWSWLSFLCVPKKLIIGIFPLVWRFGCDHLLCLVRACAGTRFPEIKGTATTCERRSPSTLPSLVPCGCSLYNPIRLLLL